jgi:hypothetical protein
MDLQALAKPLWQGLWLRRPAGLLGKRCVIIAWMVNRALDVMFLVSRHSERFIAVPAACICCVTITYHLAPAQRPCEINLCWLCCLLCIMQVSFYMRKGADLLSKWVGEAEKQLRLLFEEASKHQPAIIFFDEIDGLAPVSATL